MTVAELIDRLKAYPPQLEVMFESSPSVGGESGPIEDVKVEALSNFPKEGETAYVWLLGYVEG